MATLRFMEPDSNHRQFHNELKKVVIKYNGRIDVKEMLALTSHMVGVLVAMQDPRKMTAEKAMMMIGENIQIGNIDAMKEMPTEGQA